MKPAFFTIACAYLGAAASCFAQFWMANSLGDVDYGVVCLSIVWANVLQVLVQYGVDRTLIRDLVHAHSPKRVFVASVYLRVCLAIISFPLAAMAIFLTGEAIATRESVLVGLGFGVASAFIPIVWFDFTRRMPLQSALVLVEKILLACAIVLGVRWGWVDSAFGAISCITMAAVVGMMLHWAAISSEVRGIRPSGTEIRRMFGANTPVVLAALGNMGMTHANLLVLNSAAGKADLGHYSISFQLTRIAHLFLMQYSRLTAPQIASVTTVSTAPKETIAAFKRHVVIALFVSIAIATPVYFIGGVAIRSFLPSGFLPAVGILRVLTVWCIAFGPLSIVNRFLLCLHLQRWFLYSAVGFGLAAIVLGAVLIPYFKGVGAAVSLLFAHSGSGLVQGIVVWRHLSIRSQQ